MTVTGWLRGGTFSSLPFFPAVRLGRVSPCRLMDGGLLLPVNVRFEQARRLDGGPVQTGGRYRAGLAAATCSGTLKKNLYPRAGICVNLRRVARRAFAHHAFLFRVSINVLAR